MSAQSSTEHRCLNKEDTFFVGIPAHSPLHKLIEHLESLRELPAYTEVIIERTAIREYIRLRSQRPMRGDDFEQFRDRLAPLMSDD